jgi:lipopolysaccharide O-acetyltransferase
MPETSNLEPKPPSLIGSLRRLVRCLIPAGPAGIGCIGPGSRIGRPRKVEGSRYIFVGEGTVILPHSWLCCIDRWHGQRFTPTLRIGSGVYVGRYSCITCIDCIEIGDGCVLSEHVYVADSTHGMAPHDVPIMRQPLMSKGPVRLGAGSFVGYRACVLPGSSLGEHCVVGAGSVVTRSFPAYSMIAGCPATLIKRFDLEAKRWRSVGRRGLT